MNESILKRAILLLAVLCLLAASASAVVKPNALFTDGAVLQRGISLPVWGTANDGEKVTVKFGKQVVSTTASGGKWMVRLKPLKAGGPFTMTIAGENTIELKNILVGEVWVCSGQSNMQWGLVSSVGGEAAVAASKDPMVRLFSVPLVVSKEPLADVNSKWQECGPDTSAGFSAVGYYFGRDLRKALNVPIGLINTSWGGTIIQTWTSARTLENPSEVRRTFWNKDPNNPNQPYVLYNAMIAPLLPYAIRGAIWYQGESNAGQAYAYRKDMSNMIRDWRQSWGQGDFTFLMVQLAPFQKIQPEPTESAWAELRDAQLYTTLTCPNTGMAVITDLGDEVDIHPRQKDPVGARLAIAAEALAYGKHITYRGPVYKSMNVKGDTAVLSFDSVGGGLVAKDGDLKGFTIAGADRKFFNAEAKIQGSTVVVKSAQVANPVAVRFGWADYPVVNFYNKVGLPASPFRTDEFKMITQP